MSDLSLQQRYAPSTRCFGCGPANHQGLRIESFVADATYQHPAGLGTPPWVIATWHPQEHHEAFPGMLSGGIAGALLDCHSNWTAAWHLMMARGLEAPPCTVTAEYAVTLRRPTPTRSGPLSLHAWVVSSAGDKVVVEASLEAAGKVCATCRGTFVAVAEGHPAFNRWS
jgi:acyl-coenzyme A thioesterase PaaI-like protein